MRLRILGSAAGGGFPQWNCGCAGCARVRSGAIGARPRTQLGAAVSAEPGTWVLLGASPDVRAQIEAFPELWPRKPRDTPIAGIVLTNGDLDGVLGLFSLRESQPLRIWATDAVRAGLERNAMARTLHRFDGHSTWHRLVPGTSVALPGGIAAHVLGVPGKVPVHLEGLVAPSEGDNVGLVLRAGGTRVAWLPCVARPTREVFAVLDAADAVFFDGTFWSNDELVASGLGTRTAEAMGHWPVGGAGGSLEALARSRARTRVLVHVNNTSPLLHEGAAERAALARAGVGVAFDGMEVRA